MAFLTKLRSRLMMPAITSSREFVSYVLLVNGFGLVVALGVDVTQQLIFFSGWAAAFRSWGVTVAVVALIATPVAMIFGRAQRELQQAKKALETLSQTDPLTGLLNRRALLKASEAHTAGSLVLVILDVDRFKLVNDTYGHATGDAVLQTISRVISGHLSQYGQVGRFGGEEFAFIASGVPLEQILSALRNLLDTLEKTAIVTSGHALYVTMSAGIACRASTGAFEKIYSEADQALYAAKDAGRNRIELAPSAKSVLPMGREVPLQRSRPRNQPL